MNTVIIIIYSVIIFLLWFVSDWYREAAINARTDRKILQDRIAIGSTIVAETIVDIVHEDSSFINKDRVMVRLQDAMAGLGYVARRCTESPEAKDPTDPDSAPHTPSGAVRSEDDGGD